MNCLEDEAITQRFMWRKDTKDEVIKSEFNYEIKNKCVFVCACARLCASSPMARTAGSFSGTMVPWCKP